MAAPLHLDPRHDTVGSIRAQATGRSCHHGSIRGSLIHRAATDRCSGPAWPLSELHPAPVRRREPGPARGRERSSRSWTAHCLHRRRRSRAGASQGISPTHARMRPQESQVGRPPPVCPSRLTVIAATSESPRRTLCRLRCPAVMSRPGGRSGSPIGGQARTLRQKESRCSVCVTSMRSPPGRDAGPDSAERRWSSSSFGRSGSEKRPSVRKPTAALLMNPIRPGDLAGAAVLGVDRENRGCGRPFPGNCQQRLAVRRPGWRLQLEPIRFWKHRQLLRAAAVGVCAHNGRGALAGAPRVNGDERPSGANVTALSTSASTIVGAPPSTGMRYKVASPPAWPR